MTPEQLRNKLDTAIEKETYKLVDRISEHTFDFVHVFIMKQRLDLDRVMVNKVLELVKAAIRDGYLVNVGNFQANIKKELDEFTTVENPTQPSPKGKGKASSKESENE